ncbi:MAG: zf-HC2 domain-containing protein [Planctomycetota bacterium]|jgi:hypothetical protein
MASSASKEKGCPKPEELAILALEPTLPAGPLAKHIETCPACRQALATLQETDASLKALFVSRPSCPPPDLLAAFIDGALEGPAKSEIKGHLASCPACMEEVGAFLDVQNGSPEIVEISERALEEVKGFNRVPSPTPAPLPPAAPAPIHRAQPAAAPFGWTRILLGVAAVAAAFLLTLSLLSLFGTRTSEFPLPLDSSLTEYAGVKSPGEEPAPPASTEGTQRPPEKPSPTPAETVTPGTEPEPKPERPSSDPAPAPPETEPKETVEKPDPPSSPPKETPKESELPKPEPREPPGATVTDVPPRPEWTGRVSGEVLVQAPGSEAWKRAEKQSTLHPGSSVKVPTTAVGRIEFSGVGGFFLRGGSRLAMTEPKAGLQVRLSSGEVIASRRGKLPLLVETDDAVVEVGARSQITLVRGKGRETLYVMEGTCLFRMGEDETPMDAGLPLMWSKAEVRKKPSPFNPRTVGRWSEVLKPLAVELFTEGFNTTPRGWKGIVERKDTFRHSAGALKARVVKDADLAKAVMKVNHKPLFTVRPNIRIQMACKTTGTDNVEVRLWDSKEQRFHAVKNIRVKAGTWTRVSLRLGEAFPRGAGPKWRTRISGIMVGIAAKNGDLLVDDVAVHRIPGPPPVFLEGFGVKDRRPQCSCPGRETCESCRAARIIELLRKLDTLMPAPNGNGKGRKGGKGRGGKKNGEEEEDGENGDEEGEEEGEEPGARRRPPDSSRYAAPGRRTGSGRHPKGTGRGGRGRRPGSGNTGGIRWHSRSENSVQLPPVETVAAGMPPHAVASLLGVDTPVLRRTLVSVPADREEVHPEIQSQSKRLIDALEDPLR